MTVFIIALEVSLFFRERRKDFVDLVIVMQRALARRTADDGDIKAGIVGNQNLRLAALADVLADDLVDVPLLAGK